MKIHLPIQILLHVIAVFNISAHGVNSYTPNKGADFCAEPDIQNAYLSEYGLEEEFENIRLPYNKKNHQRHIIAT